MRSFYGEEYSEVGSTAAQANLRVPEDMEKNSVFSFDTASIGKGRTLCF